MVYLRIHRCTCMHTPTYAHTPMNACTLVHAHTCVHTHIMHMYNLNVVDGGSGPCPLQTASETKMQAHKVKTAMIMHGETGECEDSTELVSPAPGGALLVLCPCPFSAHLRRGHTGECAENILTCCK